MKTSMVSCVSSCPKVQTSLPSLRNNSMTSLGTSIHVLVSLWIGTARPNSSSPPAPLTLKLTGPRNLTLLHLELETAIRNDHLFIRNVDHFIRNESVFVRKNCAFIQKDGYVTTFEPCMYVHRSGWSLLYESSCPT